MTTTNKDVAEFYDKEWADFNDKGLSKPNSRHRTILKNLKAAGLTKSSNVLEVGCGLGSLSGLIIKFLSDGNFIGADISPKTIELLKKKYSEFKNADFLVTDMSNFKHNIKFDFVVFPDVLEHIPVEAHDNIFKTLSQITHNDSVILVNNPEPFALEWIIKNKPEQLQIIDQPLHINHFSNLSYSNGFYIESVMPYSLHTYQYDYQNIIIKPIKSLQEVAQKKSLDAILANLKSRL
ncbi:MAG: class I SAM-dependent methyltransferase [Bacteroidetes bacterium]|nr:class I SAM-dependent methyltransferase [Bacteroidota bacterium]